MSDSLQHRGSLPKESGGAAGAEPGALPEQRRPTSLTVVKPPRGAERPVLPQIADSDIGELALRVLDETAHDRVLVEPDNEDLGEARDFGERGERVPDHRLRGGQPGGVGQGQITQAQVPWS